MFDTSVSNTSESYTATACSPANLVTLRDRKGKAWVIQKELITFIREEDVFRGARVVLSNDKWFDVAMPVDELAAALGLPALPSA
ncbi:hypothetical protein [Pantoea dispersa]|uniref:hypothetical protein n=1 Tax=Pantoea dispersa TaxID=59814 RepID=UPI001F52AD9C|nr:hypothetical protein [Pantoea dispersa]MCI1029632.1 hypothetical protein [Pantoea dispersa]